MAMTFTAVQGPNGPDVTAGTLVGRLYKCTCDSSYPNTGTDATSGYKVTGKIALSNVLYGFSNPASANAMGIQAQYRPDTGYIRLVLPAAGNANNGTVLAPGELANTTNCSSLVYQFMFLGY